MIAKNKKKIRPVPAAARACLTGLLLFGGLAGAALAVPLDPAPHAPQPAVSWPDTMMPHRAWQDPETTEQLLPPPPGPPPLMEGHSQDPVTEWNNLQYATLREGDGGDSLSGQSLYSDYGEATAQGADSITLKEMLQIYVNDTGGGRTASPARRGRPDGNPGALDLVKSLLKTTLSERQADQLLAITEPWQDESGTRHFSFFGMGDFVIGNDSAEPPDTAAAPPESTGPASVAAPPRARPAPGMIRITLKERLYELIDDTIGWPMLYLLITAACLWLLIVLLFRLFHRLVR